MCGYWHHPVLKYFLGAGDGVPHSYKLISELTQNNDIPHRVTNQCVMWWREGYARDLR